jgi:hypothetical protein
MAAHKNQHAIEEITRRGVLRSGLLAGAGVATVGAASAVLTGTAKAATPEPQSGWGYCIYCATMWWVPGRSNSACVGSNSPNGEHNYGAGNYNYSIYNGPGYNQNTSPQGNWTYCSDCQGLFWGQSGSFCAGNRNGLTGDIEPHAVGSNTNYNLDFGLTGTYPQPYWRWCTQCHLLFWSGAGSRNAGACPKFPPSPSTPHQGGSTNYDAWWYAKF